MVRNIFGWFWYLKNLFAKSVFLSGPSFAIQLRHLLRKKEERFRAWKKRRRARERESNQWQKFSDKLGGIKYPPKLALFVFQCCPRQGCFKLLLLLLLNFFAELSTAIEGGNLGIYSGNGREREKERERKEEEITCWKLLSGSLGLELNGLYSWIEQRSAE